MNKLAILIICLFACQAIGYAQKPTPKNPSKIAQEALAFEKAGDFYRAGVYYESAFALDEKKLDYAFHAGRCYLESRDYANAAKNLEKVKDKNKEYDKPGYKYALSLKQTSQYEAAKTAFESFINVYAGDDKLQMKERVDTEIKGCNLALKAQENTDPNIFIEHMDANVINTDKTEFAPIPFNNDVLYFSSTVGGVASIYRTQKTNNQWIPRQSPSLFQGKMEKPHFGNGSFTPDGKRFYFTQCDMKEGSKPACAIYVMVEEGGKWGNPVKLPDYINTENTNTTHPYVTIEGDEEVLYFASNREGGKGGLDLWYCTRTVDSRGLNFSLPKNLGLNINTVGDEITPYYHTPSQTLYFSSNGRVSVGGLDIFKSQGSKLKWEVAQNLGFPLNSDGDDLYYVTSEAHGGGYFVSNRRFDPNKTATTNDDIFHFVGKQEVLVTIQGKIYAEGDASKKPLEDISLKIFELADGSEEMVFEKMFAIGEYRYVLKANKTYLFEVSKPNSKFATATFEVKTYDISRSEEHTNDVILKIPKEPVLSARDIMHKLVPTKYDGCDNAYRLPKEVPIDAKTGEPYAKGTPEYNIWQQIASKAEQATDRKIYYNDDKDDILPCVDNIAKNEPEPVRTGTTDKKPWNTEQPKDKYVEEGAEIRFKVQVAAVRYYKESRYKELFNIEGMRLDFEPIADGLTRVMIVPDKADDNNRLGFKTKAEALDALTYVMNHTEFIKAFVARYESDERKGEGFRGWDETENN